MEFLRRSLIGCDAATGGGSSPSLCLDGIHAHFLRVAIVAKYTFRVWSGFGRGACEIEPVARGIWVGLRYVGDAATLDNLNIRRRYTR